MIKKFKLETLFFTGLMLVSFMGYSVNVYADTNDDNNVENTVSISDAIKGNHLNANKHELKLNKKISLPGDKEVIPGIKGSEKDNAMEALKKAEPKPVAAPVQEVQPEPVAQPVQQEPVATLQVQAAAQPATQNVGTFKVSFYDPASLGSSMGYDGVAANLSVLPRGTRIKITTAQGEVWYKTVNDTGTFAYSNPQQIDVAMPNSMVPSYGITSATVEIIG
ncbi:hydrolase [Companilactobacillus ginsenosidimutans]|uniref:hydrolase n=1 Tax=Companilactobacillus ginsenosidimutans TaxID=1007676 RepID=UPI000AF0B408|nr:hydrolase [Companilactobacillus ginsenosidimutans]